VLDLSQNKTKKQAVRNIAKENIEWYWAVPPFIYGKWKQKKRTRLNIKDVEEAEEKEEKEKKLD
jgi:hypothetical protein